MSEKLTDALLGRLAKIEGGWDAEKYDEPAVYALVWGNDGDEVARVLDNLAIPETAQERATLIALAPELAVQVVRLRAELDKLLQAAQEVCKNWGGHTDHQNCLRDLEEVVEEVMGEREAD